MMKEYNISNIEEVLLEYALDKCDDSEDVDSNAIFRNNYESIMNSAHHTDYENEEWDDIYDQVEGEVNFDDIDRTVIEQIEDYKEMKRDPLGYVGMSQRDFI